MSPTQRSLAECKRRGWTAQVVEKWNPHARIRQDLFGCIDILAITPTGILGIQACAGSSHAARADKCRAEPRVNAWLGAGAFLAVWSWSKRGARGKRKLWSLREEEIGDLWMPDTYAVGAGCPVGPVTAKIVNDWAFISKNGLQVWNCNSMFFQRWFRRHSVADNKCHCTYEVGSGGPVCTCGKAAA